MGGGLPAAAFGGRADVMAQLAPAGPVYQAGTLSGNPLAAAAGLATLRRCTAERLRRTSTRSRRSPGGAAERRADRPGRAAPAAAGRAACSRSSSCRRAPVRDYDDARTQNTARYAAFFHAMLARGVYLPPSAYEAWFVIAGSTTTRRSTGSLDALPAAAARRPPRTGTPMSGERTDRRPPAAPRRGPQPRQGPLRPAARVPALRRRASRWREAPPRRSPTATSPRRLLPLERAQQTAAPIAAELGLR